MKKKPLKLPSREKLSPKSIYSLLSAPLPPEAYSPIPGTSRTSINDAFVRERLNEVLGPDGWDTLPPIVTCEPTVNGDGLRVKDSWDRAYWTATASVTVRIHALKKKYYGEGGHQNTDKGDARKGAVTDAFGNALKDLIAIEVYKGEMDVQQMPTVEQYSKADENGEIQSLGKFVYYYGICSQHLEPDLVTEPDGYHWFRVNRRLCYISQVDFEQYLRQHMPLECKELHVHALRDTSQRKYTHELKVTSVLQVKHLEPIEQELSR